MKDKEMIEEMARVIAIDRYNNVSSLDTATMLYDDAGYRKLPENSVVLSKGEYEKLKHFEHRVRSGVCMTQKEWFDFCNEDSNRRTCLRIEEREKERKETAEKILEHILRFANEIGVVEIPIANIKSLAILYGVEIKE